MTKQTEALHIAIETLSWFDDRKYVFEAIQTCKDALAETQEPVSYHPTSQEQSVMHQAMIRSSKLVHKATPPSREWVGLSDEEISDVYCNTPAQPISNGDVELMFDFAKAIEAKLREKNNGT